jgi:hypothetical protein
MRQTLIERLQRAIEAADEEIGKSSPSDQRGDWYSTAWNHLMKWLGSSDLANDELRELIGQAWYGMRPKVRDLG